MSAAEPSVGRVSKIYRILTWLVTFDNTILAVTLILGVVPLLLVFPAPLQDWPSHLARVHILHEILQGSANWDRYYQVNSFLIPNAALDVALLAMLSMGLSLKLASAIFLAINYAIFISGFCWLSIAFGSGGREKALFGVVLFFGSALFFGLVNFVFGIGVMLWLLGAWILADDRRLIRLAIAAGGTCVLFFCHLVPSVLFAGLIGLYELQELWVSRRKWRLKTLSYVSGLAAVATVAVLLSLSPTGRGNGFNFVWTGGTSPRELVRAKAGVLVKALLGGGLMSDGVVILGGLALFVLLLVVARVKMVQRAVVPICALAALTLIAPERVGAGSLFDLRIALCLFVFVLAGLHFTWREASAKSWFVFALALVVVMRATALGIAWLQAGREFAALERVFTSMPQNSILLTGLGVPEDEIGWRRLWEPPAGNIDALAALHGVFVPSVFAHPEQQPLVLRPAWRRWNMHSDLSSPERLLAGMQAAGSLCGNASGGRPANVSILVLYPPHGLAAYPSVPNTEMVGDHFALIRVCPFEGLKGRQLRHRARRAA